MCKCLCECECTCMYTCVCTRMHVCACVCVHVCVVGSVSAQRYASSMEGANSGKLASHSSAHILSIHVHVHCIHMYMYMTTHVRETPERQISSQLLSKEKRSCLSWNMNPQHIFYMYMYMCALPTEQLRQLSHMNMQCTCMLYSLKLWPFWTQSPYFWHSTNRHFLSFFTSPAHSNNNTHR